MSKITECPANLSALKGLTVEEIVEWDKIVESIPIDDLPRIHTELNAGSWPEELGEKPADYEDRTTVSRKTIYCLDAIRDRCGGKALSRYDRIAEGYTEKQSDDLWEWSIAIRIMEEIENLQEQVRKNIENARKKTVEEICDKAFTYALIGCFGGEILYDIFSYLISLFVS